MEAAEIETLVEELETRVDRLRALYEQYFMGIEKIEPLVQRKDVDRRLYVLRRVQIRNTALRFRFNNTIQRLNTMQQYWMRIVREIENGTYKRDVRRAAARFGADAIEGATKKRLGKLIEKVESERSQDHDFDVDVEMDELSDAEGSDEQPAPRHPPAHAGFGNLDDGDFHSPDFGDGEGFGAADVGFGSLPDVEQSSPEVAARISRALSSNPALSSFLEPEEYDASEWGAAPKASRPTTPAPPPPIERPLVSPTTEPAPPPADSSSERPIATRPSSGLLSSLGGPRRAPSRGVSDPGSSSNASAPPQAAASPVPKPGAGLLGSLSRPPAPRVQSPGNAPAKTSQSPVAAASPRPPVTPSGAAAAPPPAGAARPAVGSSGAPPVRPAVGSPAPARPSAPQAAAARAAAAPAQQPRPASGGNGADSHGLSNDRVRKIYESYVQARRACRESTSNITEGKLEEMLKQSVSKLRGKTGAKNIDFDVVIKDGKAVLKPVVKG